MGNAISESFVVFYSVERLANRQSTKSVRNPVQRGHRFQRKADSIPVIADSG
jgi:hypothetical protein